MPIMTMDFPLFVKWYVTGKCNLRCNHCYLTNYAQEVDFPLAAQIIAFLGKKRLRHISFLGGEPLVRKDMSEIIACCKDANIRTKLATNGTLITPLLASELAKSGLDQAQISFEGHSPELSDPVRGKGTFEAALHGVRLLREAGIWTSMSVTLSRKNTGFLEEIYAKAAQSFVNELKLSAFVPVGTGMENANSFLLREEDIFFIKQTLPELKKAHADMQLNSAFFPRTSQSDSKCMTFGCGAGTHSIVINNDMSVSACDLLTEEDRTLERISMPEDIEYLWKHHELFRKWRGQEEGKTKTISSFSGVHNNGCQIAFAAYGNDIMKKI